MRQAVGRLVPLVAATAAITFSCEAFAQGLVNFHNTSTTLVRTNSIGLGGSTGPTSTTLDSFVYGLFIAGPSVTNVSPLDLLTASWTFTGVYATNSAATTGGRLSGGTDVEVFGWADTTNSFVVAGWSANVAGMDWSSVGFQLAGGVLSNGVWTGPDWQAASDGGFFGVSTVGYGVAPSTGQPTAFQLFGLPYAQGVPIGTGFDLYVIHVPEPSAVALALAGTFAVLFARSRRMAPRPHV